MKENNTFCDSLSSSLCVRHTSLLQPLLVKLKPQTSPAHHVSVCCFPSLSCQGWYFFNEWVPNYPSNRKFKGLYCVNAKPLPARLTSHTHKFYVVGRPRSCHSILKGTVYNIIISLSTYTTRFETQHVHSV